MNAVRIAGIILLALVWLWLCWSLVALGGGFSIKNILVIVASGIIVFVPIWKKYIRNDNNQK
ncbi:MAG: hypothetical protein K2F94_03240 [Muribaculaceae bacterium]|nr:hypothetical protein [Muribaculaceae bacterium]MDE6532246.1 hypothetical protein [Muribaculaceae bacterium]